ncbi:uncharacterized protein LOC111684841 [Lucilia cuprina]|uniref:uncharacterized protein LOC111684841 n=1 Tax=Lucilia cuprina TaxID=7375 RepID=UPI001F0691CD|nr:uncharacterized protein LOC111684841 [Lucilia cuprina]XP_046808290.1 uncharacterized protein LOC111684841 [Lucilia cuprina]XP_046808291.1 uncharacterized protein LOC111684841 [Lucilia cuprina]
MVIMKSCCFFKNVWNGSVACAIYTMIYFAFSSLILLIYVKDEWDYLVGRRRTPKGETIIEKGDITETHVIFNIIVFICSMGLVASSIILLYGLKRHKREYLLPWILLMIGDVCVELFYAIYFIFSKRANFDPVVGFIFTIDLFIVCLNTYCLLCVISQYQEYKDIVANRTIPQTNCTTVVTSDAVGYKLNDTVAVTEKPILMKTCQLNHHPHHQHSTTRFLTLTSSHHCSIISPIPEEDASETHL